MRAETFLHGLEPNTDCEPSANVPILSETSFPSFQERYAAGAADDWTPITFAVNSIALATTQAPEAMLPPPTGRMIASTSGKILEDSQAKESQLLR